MDYGSILRHLHALHEIFEQVGSLGVDRDDAVGVEVADELHEVRHGRVAAGVALDESAVRRGQGVLCGEPFGAAEVAAPHGVEAERPGWQRAGPRIRT